MVAGEDDDETPVPLATACACVGLSVETVRAMLERGEAPELARARARGQALAMRRACGEGSDARQWAWLAERLAPRELHLPTRVQHGADPESPPLPAAVLAVTIVQAQTLARDDWSPAELPADAPERDGTHR